MTDQHTETETDLNPDEAARLLEAARRARGDLEAGRVYRTSEEGLEAFLKEIGPRFGFPVVDEQGRALQPIGESVVFTEEQRVRLAVEYGLKRGLLEQA
jgi:hypothetical protein